MRKKLLKQSLYFALGEGIYIFLVAFVIQNGEQIFGNKPGILGIITFLTLIVLSAAISGALVLGKPILMYLDGKKREAVELFAFTLGWMFVFMILALVAIILWK